MAANGHGTDFQHPSGFVDYLEFGMSASLQTSIIDRMR